VKDCIECGKSFEFKMHNQKYCSKECCREATNKKIMQKYYEKKNRLSGKDRFCDCGVKLNRYNSEDVCAMCQTSERKKKSDDMREVLASVTSKVKKTSRRPRPWD